MRITAGGPFCPATETGRLWTPSILDREEDGRWIAEVLELPGVMCYGHTRDEAISNAERLAIDVIADRIAHGELPSSALGVSFTIPDEQLARQ
jgi:predicted RNase H-like HicB family nuclease